MKQSPEKDRAAHIQWVGLQFYGKFPRLAQMVSLSPYSACEVPRAGVGILLSDEDERRRWDL